jgi:hypothetical protein
MTKNFSAELPAVRAELLIGHLQDVLAEAAAMLDSVKTRENHVILRDDLNFLRQQFYETMERVRRLEDHVALVMQEVGNNRCDDLTI